ncbi:MAG: prepilin-type N-terminal cleavage/methylation domain-containing protein [Nitrospiraceae bacterium]|nr:prepilin-type N-terminal cleavage/methylation domain-containing protein [Nitrospiraceae bacterium]
MLKRKSKGFTLVELLIVVIIIGILAGMMMLSTGGATAKAEATKIVSDMRNMKAAAIMVYADTTKWPTEIASLDEYMDQKIDTIKYDLSEEGDYVQFKVGADTDSKVRESLRNLASSGVALYKTAVAASVDITSSDIYDGGTAGVFMPVK